MYFNQLDKDKSNICISPFKLYYKVLQEGSGQALNQQTDVSIHYSIETPDHENLVNTWISVKPKNVNLSETISGFAWGIKGMKIGALREIYIHPSVGYGIYTMLEKGIHLKATVKLFGFYENQKEDKFPELSLISLPNEISPTVDSELQEETTKVAYASGYRIWSHYKKSDLYSIATILEWFERFQKGEDSDISSNRDQDIINRLHWNIYT